MTMMRGPNIVRAFMALNQAVLHEGTVPEETKMLASLACCYAAEVDRRDGPLGVRERPPSRLC